MLLDHIASVPDGGLLVLVTWALALLAMPVGVVVLILAARGARVPAALAVVAYALLPLAGILAISLVATASMHTLSQAPAEMRAAAYAGQYTLYPRVPLAISTALPIAALPTCWAAAIVTWRERPRSPSGWIPGLGVALLCAALPAVSLALDGSLEVAGLQAAVALLLGLPVAVALGASSPEGRRVAQAAVCILALAIAMNGVLQTALEALDGMSAVAVAPPAMKAGLRGYLLDRINTLATPAWISTILALALAAFATTRVSSPQHRPAALLALASVLGGLTLQALLPLALRFGATPF